LALARAAIRERGTAIVVEGYMDVIALAQGGFPHVVAPLGTAISEAQLTQLWHLADEPIICLDSDEAGLRAGQRLIERALPLLRSGKSLRFALMPRGLDPDDALRRRGVEAVRQFLNETYRLMDFLWMREVATRHLEEPEQRAALRKRLVELGRSVSDRELRRAFMEAIDRRLEQRFGRGHHRRRVDSTQYSRQAESSVGAKRLGSWIANPEFMAECELVWPVVAHPQLLAEIEEELATLELIDADLAALRDAIVAWYGEQGHLDPSGLKDHLSQIGFANLIGQLAARGSVWRGHSREPGSLLEGWRARVTQRRRFAERRETTLAAGAAIAANRDREATAQVLAVDRLINPRSGAGAQEPGVED
jgi:DNA primase